MTPRPSPAKLAVAPSEPGPIDAGEVDVGEGRTLLRLLEHGSGPLIELAWPDSAAQRAALFRHFARCFGMRVALLDRGERLFVADGARGLAWDLNLDLYSGFLRRPTGRSVAEEADEVRRIRLYHGGLAAARTVRLFPRLVDARLLAGLSQLVGPQYRDLTSIRGRYRLGGADLTVERVEADGRPLPGRIDLTPAQTRACG